MTTLRTAANIFFPDPFHQIRHPETGIPLLKLLVSLKFKNKLQIFWIQSRIVRMIREQDIRDDNGNLFGFGSHLYRHYYGVKLTEMHLDDWTIAKLLGHNNLKNVKYYRKMSNQILADDTRKARKRLSDIILENLDGWGDEYEQIRQDGGM